MKLFTNLFLLLLLLNFKAYTQSKDSYNLIVGATLNYRELNTIKEKLF